MVALLGASHDFIVTEVVRIYIVVVDSIIALLITREIRGVPLFCFSFCQLSLAQIARSIDMWKSALFVTADTCVSIIGTFKHVTLSAVSTLFAVANRAKGPTNRCRRIDSDVSIATVWVGAIATEEMSASRNTMRGGFMGEVASFTSNATASSEEIFADGGLVRIMRVVTAIAVGTHTYKQKSARIHKAYQRTW